MQCRCAEDHSMKTIDNCINMIFNYNTIDINTLVTFDRPIVCISTITTIYSPVSADIASARNALHIMIHFPYRGVISGLLPAVRSVTRVHIGDYLFRYSDMESFFPGTDCWLDILAKIVIILSDAIKSNN